MNTPQDPEAAETDQTESIKALVQSRFVRHDRQFGEVWVASQDGMAAIGATRKDAISGLDACLKCKTLAPFRWPNDQEEVRRK